MAIIIVLISLSIFITTTYTHKVKQRKTYVSGVFLAYIFLILINQIYLNSIGISFQPSDPENYFNVALYSNSYSELIQSTINDSNIYYYVINKIFINTFENKDLVAVFLQITNLLLFLASYLFATKNIKIHKVEILLLIHPYLALIVIRNVRDLHILSLSIIILSLALHHKETIKKSAIYLGISLARPFFTAIIFISRLIERKKNKISPKKTYTLAAALIFCFILVFFISNSFYSVTVERIVSGYGFYNGYDGKYIQLKSAWLSHDRSPSFIIEILGIFLTSVVKFIFTPIIPNYLEKYLAAGNGDIFLDIYTDMDMALIFLGAFLNVIYFIPLFIKISVRNLYNAALLDAFYLCSIFIILIYSFAHLGGTDIRIRYTFIFFMSLSLVFRASPAIKNSKLVAGSIIVLIILPSLLIALRAAQ